VGEIDDDGTRAFAWQRIVWWSDEHYVTERHCRPLHGAAISAKEQAGCLHAFKRYQQWSREFRSRGGEFPG
jgi:hypothetical protein